MCAEAQQILEDKLAQLLSVQLQLQTRRRNLLFSRRQTGNPAHLRIRMVGKIGFRHEVLILQMLQRFLQDSVIKLVMESELIARHIQIDILCYRQFNIVALHILHHDMLFSVVYDQLHQQVFHLQQLVQRRHAPHGSLHSLLWGSSLRVSQPSCAPFSLHLLAHTVSHEVVQRIHDNRLVHAQSVGAVGDIRGSGNLVLDLRDALHDAVDCLASLHRIGHAVQREVGLKLYEVLLVFLYVFSEIGSGMASGKAVRVVSIRQEEHLHVHLLLQQHVGTSQRRMHSRSIAVVEQYDVAGESVEQSDLMDAQRRTRVGHHILDAALVHGDYIRISLHHIHAVFLGDGLLCLIQSVEFTLLVVDDTVGRVHVFLAHTLGTGIQHTSAESHHLSAHTQPREDGAPGESVQILVLSALVARFLLVHLEAETGIHQVFRLISFLHRLVEERRALVQGESQLEFPDDVVSESSASEILHADGSTIHIILQDVLEVFRRPFIHDEHRFAFVFAQLLLVGHLAFLNLDMVFVSQPSQCLRIGHLLQLHQEVDGVSTLSAGKAMADATRRRNGEGWM